MIYFTFMATLAAGQVATPGPGGLMAPGPDSYCVYADGSDGSEGYFSYDFDSDGSEEAGETFIFPPRSRWLVSVYSGSGTAKCCWTDEQDVPGQGSVGDPANVHDIHWIDTSSTAGEGPGACFTLSNTRSQIMTVADRSKMTGLTGIYSGVCTSTADADVPLAGTATTAYPFNGRVRKGCASSSDCQDADHVNGITFASSGGSTPQCTLSPTHRQLQETGLLLVCNYTADIDLVACEKK